jgi:hypothetical protein
VILQFVDAVHSFRGFYLAEGWAHDGTGPVAPELILDGRLLPASSERVMRPDLQVLGAPGLCGYRLRYIMGDGESATRLALRFRNDTEEIIVENPGAALFAAKTQDWAGVQAAFLEHIRAAPGARILELGSRARSGITRRDLFDGLEYTGFDIIAGENVDVIGDAHRLSTYFLSEHFDFAYSVSVFEHLMWPWKVVLELNEVIKTGGIVLSQSHQTWPVHDAPWDFFRFSDSAWRGLFCETTGFRVLHAVQSMPAHTICAHYSGQPHLNFGTPDGYLVSICTAQKVGKPFVQWDAQPSALYLGDYPA